MTALSTNGRPVRLRISQIKAICPRMGLRPLFALLIAVAMLFAPLAIQSGSAMAMAPAADHHAQMMDSGHCGDQPSKDNNSMSDDKSCCVAMCTAIAVAPMTPEGPHVLASSTKLLSLAQFHHGFLAKLPTPPPRLA